jgi:hypothetical protein
MLLLIGSLIKSGIASLHGALEGFFPCVNADVIKQIVPLGENL